MVSLTTRQRDILQILLASSVPLGTADIARQMNLSPRQVNYSLKGMQYWLSQKDIRLHQRPGVGVELECSPEQSKILASEIASKSSLQLILSSGQRQQLLALMLLTQDEPLILLNLQQWAEVSRATILKDLDEIEAWLASWELALIRKPNFGIVVEGKEFCRQQAMAALVWGEIPFSDPIAEMTHTEGLVFDLESDAGLLPIVAQAEQTLSAWNTQRVVGQVANAEEQLGGRFTDDAVLHISLVLAILAQRVTTGHHLEIKQKTIDWLKSLPVWQVARLISMRLVWSPSDDWQDSDIAGIAMHLLAAERSEIWPGDLDRDQSNVLLIEQLLDHIGEAYNQSSLKEDRTLRDGLTNHIIPACLRLRFRLWLPSTLTPTSLDESYQFEYKTAQELAAIVKDVMGVQLPENEVNNLALLLRAAYIRIRPYRFNQVIVVCPSGMATAQLLVARLEARFPRLGTLKVVSLRKLSPELAKSADLILTTVPLQKNIQALVEVIQVHPLLMPEDVDAITRFLS